MYPKCLIMLFYAKWSAGSLGNSLKLRCNLGIIGLGFYRSVSVEVSKRTEMSFMKSNGKSRVEGTKQPVWSSMRRMLTMCMVSALVLTRGLTAEPYGNTSVPEGRKLNNLVELLLDVVPAPTIESFTFVRPSDGWVFISFTTHGEGTIRLTLDKASLGLKQASSIRFQCNGASNFT